MFDGKTEEEIKDLKQKNKKAIGKMKDELGGNLMLEFLGLRAKA